MKQKTKLQKCITTITASVVLAGGISLSQAADTIIVNRFDSASELSSWSELTGNGSLQYLADSGGCLKVILPAASGGSQVQPSVALGSKSFNSAQYWSVSFDLKVDPSSGLSPDGTTFGHWQLVVRNSGGSWQGLNWSVLDSSYTNGWRHIELGLVQPYDTIASMVIQVQGGPYAGDLIYYLDNILVNPLPFSIMLDAFTSASEVAAYSSWGASGSGISWVNIPDAGGLKPAGSMQILGNYDGTVPGWSESTCQRDFSFDPSRFTYFDLDAYLASSSAQPYGMIQVFLRQNHAPWNWLWLGNHNFAAADVGKWTHLSLPMAPSGETNASGFVIQTGGNGMLGPVTINVDNVKIWTPQIPPTLKKVARGGPAGTTITMDQNGQQWQRDAIATPSGNYAYTWYNNGPVTYSFTIANFPDASAHHGFEAHLYIVNEDTLTDPAWSETYGAVDWNASDILVAQLENIASGGVDFSLHYKTNLPNANLDHTLGTIHAVSALGTWSVTFGSDNVSVTLTAPDGTTTDLSLPQEVADRFNCLQSFLQFGVSKNDLANSGLNDGASATFSRVQMTGGPYAFDDTFAGPGLTANYLWRTTSASAVNWSPDGIGWWLTWTLPDDGFSGEVAPSVTGPWTDAGITYKYAQGAARVGAVPAANIPVGNAAFFRLSKPVTP